MKTKLFLLAAVCLSVLASCRKDVDAPPAASTLEIELVPDWEMESMLGSGRHELSLQVKFNVETVGWAVTLKDHEDSFGNAWLTLGDNDEDRRGDGSLALSVIPNMSFENRVAEIVISAGQYSQSVYIDQAGRIFMADDVYAVKAPDDTEGFDVVITAMSDWTIQDSEWIHAEKGDTVPAETEGFSVTTLSIRCDANPDEEGRYGTISLIPSDGASEPLKYAVYQFGNEFTFDEQNNMEVDGQTPDKFSIVVPGESYIVEEKPEWVEYTLLDATEEGAPRTYEFTTKANMTDIREGRLGLVKLCDMQTDIRISLPGVSQGYGKIGGLVTARGFNEFMAAFNAGEDIGHWQADGEAGTVKMLGDIDFTDIALTGSVGNEEHPMDLVFDGGGFTIKNLEAQTSLFGLVGESGEVRDLTVDNTSRIRVAEKPAVGSEFSPMIARNKGKVTGCTNNASADIGFAFTESISLGGIVAWNDGGTIENCTNNGGMTVNPTAIGPGTASTAEIAETSAFIAIGGIAGRSTGESVIKNCTSGGAINERGKVRSAYIGGICGDAAGTIENCEATTGSIITVASDVNNRAHVGGIAGQLQAGGSLTGSTNRGNISSNLLRNDDMSRYEYCGGIAGLSYGANTGNRNYGAISSTSNVKALAIGGIAGFHNHDAFTGNTNYGAVNVVGNGSDTAVGARYVTAGGLAGTVSTATTGEVTGANSGNITIDRWEATVTYATMYAAGGIGDLSANATGITNSGNVVVTATAPNDILRSVLGGVVGAAMTKDITVTDCSNSGRVEHGRTGDGYNNASQVLMGGVVGYMQDFVFAVDDCLNTGTVLCNFYDNNFAWLSAINKASHAGGVVGGFRDETIEGAGSIAITGCTNEGEVNSYRGWAGGIIAGISRLSTTEPATSSTISGCRNTGDMSKGNRGTVGGVVGSSMWVDIADCTVKTGIYGSNPGGAVNRMGGIVGEMLSGTHCKDSKYYGAINRGAPTVAAFDGGISGSSAAGTENAAVTIDNCGFGGSIIGAPISDLGSVCGDANFVSTTANYLWDGQE